MKKPHHYMAYAQVGAIIIAGWTYAANPKFVDFMNENFPPDSQSPIAVFGSTVTSGTSTAPSYVTNVASGPEDLAEAFNPNVGQMIRPEQFES